MEKQDLLVSLTIDHYFPGKHRVATRFFFLARPSLGRFFSFPLPKDFYLHRSNRKELPRGNFCQVRDVNKNFANDMKYERWAFAAKISLGVPPVDKILTPS